MIHFDFHVFSGSQSHHFFTGGVRADGRTDVVFRGKVNFQRSRRVVQLDALHVIVDMVFGAATVFLDWLAVYFDVTEAGKVLISTRSAQLCEKRKRLQ